MTRATAHGCRGAVDRDAHRPVVDLFALIAALVWLGDPPALAPRADHLFDVMARAVLA